MIPLDSHTLGYLEWSREFSNILTEKDPSQERVILMFLKPVQIPQARHQVMSQCRAYFSYSAPDMKQDTYDIEEGKESQYEGYFGHLPLLL